MSVTWWCLYTFGGYRLTEIINKNNLNGDTLILTCTASGPVFCPVTQSLGCTHHLTVSLIPEFMVIESGCPIASPQACRTPHPGFPSWRTGLPRASAGSLPETSIPGARAHLLQLMVMLPVLTLAPPCSGNPVSLCLSASWLETRASPHSPGLCAGVENTT